ncbi:phenylacetate--CoA ligase family protein [Clostridium psychrophilum]|uniref:phenylacetate--CoA ligase family protein n=1 Tax=Clostridium psychrophilum TaxID=132926 RepID=UPI001C0AF39F|nr:phenylacetate--CoA ligase family protein [Clostridium psychrophilum]MBU3180282.1 phenylacetate--CoA ligase family protein [Clostridium psychrophilum]
MIKQIIKKMPDIIKKPIINSYNSLPDVFKYGKIFNNTYKFLKLSETWSEKQLSEYQLKKVKEIIKYSYANVPYYKRLFNENNIKPEYIQDLNDLKRIPYLTKEIIQNNLDDLISKEYNKKDLRYVTTGGSTGIPMGFYQDKSREQKIEWAYTANLWSRIGYDIKKSYKMVILRGNIPKVGDYEYIGNNLILSSFNLIENNMDNYIKRIIDFKPDFIQAYPSTISLLSKHIIDSNINISCPNLKAIICASENLYDFQRKQLEQAFNTRVYSFYGHTEHSCLAGECEKSNYYHLQSEYGYTELINESGHDVLEEDEAGEIVCTGFNNHIFPFIRYRTGDIAINSNEECSCKRNYKLIKKIEGRQQDYFIDKTGSKVTFIYCDVALWEVKHKIYLYQYVQNELGRVELYIQCKIEFTKEDKECVIRDFKKFYPRFDIELYFTDHIEKTKVGKFRYLVQNIKI